MTVNRPVQLTRDAFAKLGKVSTATITTQLLKRGFHNTFLALKPLRPDMRMVGYAFTLRYVPMREDLTDTQYDNEANVQRIAVETVTNEDVLIIEARGDIRAASFGHILATRIHARGAAGLVTDGALRDTPGFKKLGLPSYCKASHATTSFVIHHPLKMNVPIGCAGVLIMPGDVLVGDGEGVVAIPAQVAEEVANDAYEQEQREAFYTMKVAKGASIMGVYPPSEKTLAEYAAWQEKGGANDTF